MTSSSHFTDIALRALRIRNDAGGLEVSASALRFVWQEGGVWKFASVPLPPGVVVDGAVEDAAQFKNALRALKQNIVRREKTPVHAIVSLDSTHIYTQAFGLPLLEGRALEEAARLNLEMSSPIEFSNTYAGWQVIGKDEKSLKLDVLAGFVERGIVDSFLGPMREAGFVVGAVEPRMLSFVRTLRTLSSGFDPAEPSLAVTVDDAGIALVVLRGGELAFQYLVPWSDVVSGGKEISWDVFRGKFLEEGKKVLSFWSAHWSGIITTAFLAAGNMEENVRGLVAELGLEAKPIALASGDDIGPEWFASLGAGLRGLGSLREDRSMSLLGLPAREEFYREQTLRFLHFWRAMTPALLFILLAITWGASAMIRNTRTKIEVQATGAAREESTEIKGFSGQVKAFNALTASVAGALDTATPKIPQLEEVQAFFSAHDVSIQSASIDAGGGTALHARIPSEEKLLTLAEDLRNQKRFQNVNLPLQDIATDSQGVSFFITFTIAASKAP